MVFGIGIFQILIHCDFRDFMGVILTVPYEELKLVLDTHSKLKDKYDILVNYFKMKYQIDLVAIGNKQFK